MSRFGNFLTVDKLKGHPTVRFLPDAESLVSMIFFDADHPIPEERRLGSLILWSKANMKVEAGKELVIREGDDHQVHHPYIPPHPARGTSSHRFVSVIFQHDSPLTLPSDRIANVKEILEGSKATVKGYSFFRSCWTKEVSRIYAEILQQAELRFGDLAPPIPVRPYKYANF